MTEIYCSTDVETDGPIPGPHSMLSFGSAAFMIVDGKVKWLSTFARNLETLAGASPDPDTAAWWKTQPEAWAACRQETQEPRGAMLDYVTWLKGLSSKPVFVGYPAGFDFLFVYWYLIKFAGQSPFSFSAVDIKTYAMALLKTGYRDVSKRTMPPRWFGEKRHTHVALDDALEQGELFANMLIEHTR